MLAFIIISVIILGLLGAHHQETHSSFRPADELLRDLDTSIQAQRQRDPH